MSRTMICLGARDVILWVVMAVTMDCLCVAGLDSAKCLRTQRYMDGRCEECPRCAAGYGLSGDCGHGRGGHVKCVPCDAGFFNPPPGGTSCKACRNCSVFHRQEAFRCRAVIDAECGACEDGYYERERRRTFGGNLLFPCISCSRDADNPECRHTSTQVVAPVTIRLQANLESQEEMPERESQRPISLMAVILGVGCLLTLIVLTLFLLHHRKLVRRMRNSTQESQVTTQQDVARQKGYTNDSSSRENDDDAEVWTRMDSALHHQTTRWRHEYNPQHDLADTKRKRYKDSKSSFSDDQDALESNDQDYLLVQPRSRKRTKVRQVDSSTHADCPIIKKPREGELRLNEATMTLTLKPKQTTLTCVTEDHQGSNNPSCSEHYDIFSREREYKREDSTEDGAGTDAEEEEEDGISEGDLDRDRDCVVSMEDEETPLTGAGCGDTQRDDRDDTNPHHQDENEADDLQQYGACALPPRRRSATNAAWPYVDFRDLPASSWHPTSGLGDLGLDLDLSLDPEDAVTSRGSSGNVSQASTVLIRGISGSPPNMVMDDIVLGANDTGGIPEESDPFTFRYHSSFRPIPALGDNIPPGGNPEPPGPPTGVTGESIDPPSVVYQPLLSSYADVTNSFTHISIADACHVTYPAIGPPPRHLARLAHTFTGSQGDVAQSAEADTESIPRMLGSLDEERYAQALRLANDRLVGELDFDMTERLAACLHPRPLVGDRNFRHLGAALGVPPEVMGGVRAFDELLAHLRRMRVSLVVLLKAVRALGRMDVVFLVSVWVLDNFFPPGVGPLVENEQTTVPVQETGEAED